MKRATEGNSALGRGAQCGPKLPVAIAIKLKDSGHSKRALLVLAAPRVCLMPMSDGSGDAAYGFWTGYRNVASKLLSCASRGSWCSISDSRVRIITA